LNLKQLNSAKSHLKLIADTTTCHAWSPRQQAIYNDENRQANECAHLQVNNP